VQSRLEKKSLLDTPAIIFYLHFLSINFVLTHAGVMLLPIVPQWNSQKCSGSIIETSESPGFYTHPPLLSRSHL